MPHRRIHTTDGTTVDVWEERDAENAAYESRSVLNANGWLNFRGRDHLRALRLYPRDWCDLSEQRLRELYGRARPRR